MIYKIPFSYQLPIQFTGHEERLFDVIMLSVDLQKQEALYEIVKLGEEEVESYIPFTPDYDYKSFLQATTSKDVVK